MLLDKRTCKNCFTNPQSQMGLRAVPFLGNDIGFGAGPVGIFGQVTKLQRLLSARMLSPHTLTKTMLSSLRPLGARSSRHIGGLQEQVAHRAVSSSERRFSRSKEEIMTRIISVLMLGAVLAFSMASGAWAQSGGAGGAGGGTGGAGGGAAGTGAVGGSGVGGRGAPGAQSPNVNPSSPSTLPQSNERPVSPGTGPGTNTH